MKPNPSSSFWIIRAERERIARLLSRWNYVDGKAAARHIRKQGREHDKRRDK